MARRKLDEKLLPLSVRVTPLQTRRLERITAFDGLPTQDHIRRALDVYMNQYEKQNGLRPLTETQAQENNNA
jgi:hypothetical protein